MSKASRKPGKVVKVATIERGEMVVNDVLENHVSMLTSETEWAAILSVGQDGDYRWASVNVIKGSDRATWFEQAKSHIQDSMM